MAAVWFWTAIRTRPRTFWKKLSRPIEAVPGGARKQAGSPCETLLDRGPLLSVPQGQMASPLDEGRTPWMYSGACQSFAFCPTLFEEAAASACFLTSSGACCSQKRKVRPPDKSWAYAAGSPQVSHRPTWVFTAFIATICLLIQLVYSHESP